MYLFQGETADEVWRQAYRAVTTSGTHQSGRGGSTVELLHVVLEVRDPRQRWIVSRRPVINPAFGIAEVVWLLAGSNDAGVLNYWFPRLPEFAGESPTYDGAYGYRLRKQFNVDQVRRAYEALSANPSTRQVVLQYWDPRFDLPQQNGLQSSADIPCNLVSLLKIRDGRLEWTQVMRSNDLIRGLPTNFAQFTCLQEIMAGWLGVEVGSYHHWSDSLHVYSRDFSKFSCVPDVPPLAGNTDSLAIDMVRGEAVILELYRRMVEMTAQDVGIKTLEDLASFPNAPHGYQNLLRVLGAESSRRRDRREQAAAMMAECTNPQLVQAWMAWTEQMLSKTDRLASGSHTLG
jgi:Thymidylate synthase